MCDDKKIADILHEEMNRVRDKSTHTDEWFYRMISVVIIPFFIIIGYSLIDIKYRIIALSLPFFSILGVLLTFMLLNHYAYVTNSCRLLEERLNFIVSGLDLRGEELSKIFYGGKLSIPKISFFVGFMFLVGVNIFAYPIIESVLQQHLTQSFDSCLKKFFIEKYWIMVVVSSILTAGTCAATMCYSNYKAKQLVSSYIRQMKQESPNKAVQ